MWLSSCVDIHADDTKAMVSKTPGIVALIRTAATNRIYNHCIHCHTRVFVFFLKKPVLLNNILDEAVKIISFIKSQHLSTPFYYSL